LEGRYSDINVTVFGTTYHLHRLVLDRAPFFASALSPPWLEATAKEVTLHPEDIDSNITRTAFELALRRLYGHPDPASEAKEAFSLFATACWLEMNELVSASVEHLLRQMQLGSLASMISMVTVNYYGKAGGRVLHAAKAMLSRDGFEMPLRYWDDIPSEVIGDVIGGDSFYVFTEWQRWLLAKRIFNRHLKLVARELGLFEHTPSILRAPFSNRGQLLRADTSRGKSPIRSSADNRDTWMALYNSAEVLPLIDLLENGIYYVHFDFEQLQHIRSAQDIFGVLLLPDSVANEALWTGLELRQKIVNAKELDDDLGFSQPGVQSSQSPVDNALSSPSTPLATQSLHLEVPAEDRQLQNLTPIKPSTQYFSNTDGAKQYWIPCIDCNIVTGGVEPIITLSTSISDRAAAKERTRTAPINEQPRPTSYTTYPPFRFSAEFSNPRQFKPGKKTYSQTVFYAGSSWNLYLQRNKNTGSRSSQLGVYLHRAAEQPVEDDPWSSSGPSVDDRIGDLERQLHRLESRRSQTRRAREPAHVSPNATASGTASAPQDQRMPSMVTDSTGLSSFMTSTNRRGPTTAPPTTHDGLRTSLYQTHPSDNSNDADESGISADESTYSTIFPPGTLMHGKPALNTYVDGRPIIKAYFKIYSPSRDGRMLSVYESAPDEFSFSQSWGWRSSSFFTDENEWLVDEVDLGEDSTSWLPDLQEGRDERYTQGEAEDKTTDTDAHPRQRGGNGLAGGKLRFMVTLGVV